MLCIMSFLVFVCVCVCVCVLWLCVGVSVSACASEISPVEQDVGLCVLHHCFVHLSHILVIKLIPLTVNHILAVCYVVTT